MRTKITLIGDIMEITYYLYFIKIGVVRFQVPNNRRFERVFGYAR